MAALNPRRRRKVASGAVRAALVLLVVLVTAFALHHPVTHVLRNLAQLAPGKATGGKDSDGRGDAADGRSLTGKIWIVVMIGLPCIQ